ncbi:MAG: helix-turn-helix transcriptional regulator [Lachnospiraceae bacterium]|nr:helix-turn-helix transcriptional regulator [Lachnospiraceae bacterium]
METGNKQETGVIYLLGENLAKARDVAGMTQKQVAEETGIYQADISKIERGLANPSVSTLQRLAEGMGMKLKIEFVQEEQS